MTNQAMVNLLPPITRRLLLSRAGAVAAGSALAIVGVRGAGASWRWCATDPLVSIDGRLGDIFLASDLSLHATASGPSIIRIAIPRSSTGEVVASDLGFGLKGYDIAFATDASLKATPSHTPISIAVYSPSTDPSLPLKVTFAPRDPGSSLEQILLGASAEGMVNEWIYLIT